MRNLHCKNKIVLERYLRTRFSDSKMITSMCFYDYSCILQPWEEHFSKISVFVTKLWDDDENCSIILKYEVCRICPPRHTYQQKVISHLIFSLDDDYCDDDEIFFPWQKYCISRQQFKQLVNRLWLLYLYKKEFNEAFYFDVGQLEFDYIIPIYTSRKPAMSLPKQNYFSYTDNDMCIRWWLLLCNGKHRRIIVAILMWFSWVQFNDRKEEELQIIFFVQLHTRKYLWALKRFVHSTSVCVIQKIQNKSQP